MPTTLHIFRHKRPWVGFELMHRNISAFMNMSITHVACLHAQYTRHNLRVKTELVIAQPRSFFYFDLTLLLINIPLVTEKGGLYLQRIKVPRVHTKPRSKAQGSSSEHSPELLTQLLRKGKSQQNFWERFNPMFTQLVHSIHDE